MTSISFRMRRILPLLFAMALTGSCSIEMSGNGDLDGFWHLERIDTLDTGGTLSLADSLRFWAVQAKLLAWVDRGNAHHGGYFGYLARFDHSAGRLRVYQPYLNDRANGDIPVEDAAELAPFGVNALDETFTVEELSGSSMTLRSDVLRLWFRKF